MSEAEEILIEPHITEKATELAQKNQYVFKVNPKANKTEVKKAVEQTYDVDVKKVRAMNAPRKKRRKGRIEGYKKGFKKAIVKIREDQKIEIMPR
ncbi:MAG: 50S ribosomal protein L23 [Candidatus Paceibacterota bacterium]